MKRRWSRFRTWPVTWLCLRWLLVCGFTKRPLCFACALIHPDTSAKATHAQRCLPKSWCASKRRKQRQPPNRRHVSWLCLRWCVALPKDRFVLRDFLPDKFANLRRERDLRGWGAKTTAQSWHPSCAPARSSLNMVEVLPAKRPRDQTKDHFCQAGSTAKIMLLKWFWIWYFAFPKWLRKTKSSLRRHSNKLTAPSKLIIPPPPPSLKNPFGCGLLPGPLCKVSFATMRLLKWWKRAFCEGGGYFLRLSHNRGWVFSYSRKLGTCCEPAGHKEWKDYAEDGWKTTSYEDSRIAKVCQLLNWAPFGAGKPGHKPRLLTKGRPKCLQLVRELLSQRTRLAVKRSLVGGRIISTVSGAAWGWWNSPFLAQIATPIDSTFKKFTGFFCFESCEKGRTGCSWLEGSNIHSHYHQ